MDVETDEKGEIFALGAVFQDRTWQRRAPFNLKQVMSELDQFASGADYLVGHNIIRHDLPYLTNSAPDLKLLEKLVIDTLLFSPLAFPENPYHRLVKDYKLVRDSMNEPLNDALLTLTLLGDQWQAMQAQNKEGALLSFYHFTFSAERSFSGLQQALVEMGAEPVDQSQAYATFQQLIPEKVCNTALANVVMPFLTESDKRCAVGYCLAWLLVADGNSVLPPWVRHQFPEVSSLLRQLRDIPCEKFDCDYCQATHDPVKQLSLYFGFSGFRPEPADIQGNSLQQAIIQAAMCDSPLFAVLPTGGGKSLCFQLPALIRYQRRGVLSIIISPLQALMKDQVDNLRNKTGAPNAAALNGTLTAPERGEVLQAIQMGDIALLYVSPEQLRNTSFQKAIAHREIGCWIFDEAHCLSKWGHDFRPDYLYAARFIKEFSQQQKVPLPPVQCFTATAKQDVKQEIIDYFYANLGQQLTVFEGGVERDNLQFEVQMVNAAEKYPRMHLLLLERLSDDGSAIIYCSTRTKTEEVAVFLQRENWQIEAFHAGKNPAEKKHIQDNFISGDTRIIAATNAFGMGIDKDNVRLVIHADIPGSLENYLQEAGRAGRDQQHAECVLLFDENDIDTQFKLSASSQLNQRDINQILRGLRRAKKDRSGNVVLTTGELLMNDSVETSFGQDDYNADTKVKTAISWLERAGFIQRNENKTNVFQGRPLVKNLDEAHQKIAKLNLSQRQQARWVAILETLFNAKPDESFSADELAQSVAFTSDEVELRDSASITPSQRVIRTLFDMANAGIVQKSLLMTAFIRFKGINSSSTLLQKICVLENALLQLLQEQSPDAESYKSQQLSLRSVNQRLLEMGCQSSNPEILRSLLVSISRDGLGLAGQKGSLQVRHRGLDQYHVKLNRGWKALRETAERRQLIAQSILSELLQKVPKDTVGSNEVLVDFAVEDLLSGQQQDQAIFLSIKDPLAAIDRALNYMHEQKIINLQKGLAVFRQAMTIEIKPEAKSRRYSKGDYEPLSQHYGERVFQVHVMNEFARRGLEKISHALSFVLAYFTMDKTEFVKRYFADRQEVLERAASQQAFQRIVNDLQNPEQMALVAGHENDNRLILAGPGSGKTRVVVHRCAYLLKVKQIPARSILVLCFNRNAVTELRRRLLNLIGDAASGVTIQTYHGLSLRLTGHTFTVNDTSEISSGSQFANVIKEAIALLQGKKNWLGVETDDIRERLLSGYRHILVDEYQDIDAEQYQLVSAIAGRTLDDDAQLTIMAVGDDDQNIYQFRGANVGFLNQFEQDYQAQTHYLVENYRSSQHIIAVSNQLIDQNCDRMKTSHPIRINKGRKSLESGGRWQKLDTLAKGRVQRVQTFNEWGQAQAAVEELKRLRQLDNRLDWQQCAILAREWQYLSPVRALLEEQSIPVSIMLPSDRLPPPFRIRENRLLLEHLQKSASQHNRATDWLTFLDECHGKTGTNHWIEQLNKLLMEWQQETDNQSVCNQQTLEFLYESLGELKKERRLGHGVFLSTIHAVKGMEFDHVFILDGGWKNNKLEEQRRLYYVAMTRAKETLCLFERSDLSHPFLTKLAGDHVLTRTTPGFEHQQTVDRKHYTVLGLKDFDISFAGCFKPAHPIHQHLSEITPGITLKVLVKQDQIFFLYGGLAVAKLSGVATRQWLNQTANILMVKVIAMIKRYRDDSDESYRSRCQTEYWDVPMVEITYKSSRKTSKKSIKALSY